MHKRGICHLVRKCLPNLCVHTYCTTNNVNNTATPTVVTYAPQALEHQVAGNGRLLVPGSKPRNWHSCLQPVEKSVMRVD